MKEAVTKALGEAWGIFKFLFDTASELKSAFGIAETINADALTLSAVTFHESRLVEGLELIAGAKEIMLVRNLLDDDSSWHLVCDSPRTVSYEIVNNGLRVLDAFNDRWKAALVAATKDGDPE